MSEKVIFFIASVILTVSAFSLLYKVSDSFMTEIPAHGGSITEGIIGTPRFINPLLASSDADRDLSALVYSGLLKSRANGSFVPDLAESYSVSEDGLVYSFIIRNDAVFHDGNPVTSEDIEFTVTKAQDPSLKSPRRVLWEGVTIEKRGSHEIAFILKQPYAPFIGNLTMGILPKHIWQNLNGEQFPFSESNVNPIGSGPYKISKIDKTADGLPVSYSLSANEDYSLGEPYVSNLKIRFYSNDSALVKALESHEIESASNLGPISAGQVASSTSIMRSSLTRVFGIFFNQNNKELLAHKEIRKALNDFTDKDDLIDNVLSGYGNKADNPLPDVTSGIESISSFDITKASSSISALAKAGWKRNPETGIYEIKTSKTAPTSTLSFSLATANVPELTEAASHITDKWRGFGIDTEIKVFESSDLNQSVIRPRKYDAILFGMVTSKIPDLYVFWHSSQRNDPGLNIAMYTNTKADSALEEMRKSISQDQFNTAYEKFNKEIMADTPAIFLWSPDFIYALPDKLKGVELGPITTPSDRFSEIEKWYVDKEKVWQVFAD